MSFTPQDNARLNHTQGNSSHIFQGQHDIPNTSSPSQQRASYSRLPPPPPPPLPHPHPHPQSQSHPHPHTHTHPHQQHKSPYTYIQTSTPGSVRQDGNTRVSAEQQIAQGALNQQTSSMRTSSTPTQPARRPPPLGTTIHIPTPSNTPPSLVRNPPSANQSIESRPQSSNASPAPVNVTQDTSNIDPQLMNPSPSELTPQQWTPGGTDPSPSQPALQQRALGGVLSAPPEGSYPTFDALFAAAQAHALAHGYAFVIGRSKRDNRGLKKVFLTCDRGGVNKEKVPGDQRKRKTHSRKCGCEFGIFGLETKSAWILRGRIDGEHLAHNHGPSESPTEHPAARKLTPQAIAAVKSLEANGVSVRETLEILHREHPETRYLPRDIYNARAAIKRDPSRVEASATEALPTIYKKPAMTFEEKLRAELRTEVANAQAEVEKTKEEWRKEVETLKEKMRKKDKLIERFEMFIDICNERVMVQRSRLAEAEGEVDASGNGTVEGPAGYGA